ncbi:MAG TPA: iron uptake system protein EfeO [Rubrobacteraceae bacterium]|nr:iron uptake system protein EfeO [Rubrobacteraceae bacterium]
MAAGRVAILAVALFFIAGLTGGCGQPPPSGGGGDGSGETTGEGETTSETPGESTGETSVEETTMVDVGGTPELAEAADQYEEYVAEQIVLLDRLTGRFVEAVLAGDVERAKELYAPARVPWERIEPIAAQLGDYDPRIDAREGDVPDSEWRGFHRIEKALWIEGTTEGQEEYARQLREDVGNLREEIDGLELEPVDLVTGSVELLNEVSAGKITGEEERYSHTDLYDIAANVEGSEAAFEELKPEVAGEDLTLANEVEEGFDGVYEELEPYSREGGWVSYEQLDEADRRALSQKVDALAESLSRVGQVLEEG